MSKRTKKALVLEGGGIRSSFLSGVLLAFQDAGMKDFDVVIGTSAGSCCGANFISGEADKNKTILENHLTGNRFVRLNKILSRENILDIDFLVDEVCKKIVPLNPQKIKESATKLFITATDYETGEPYYFNNHDHDIFESLRASCALPYLYRKKVYFKGRRYLDGGMSASIPIEKAIEEGCNEIFVVSTREAGYRKEKDKVPPWLHDVFWPDNPRISEMFQRRHEHYNKAMDIIDTPPDNVKIHLIAPTQRLPVTRMTREKEKVSAAINQGYDQGMRFIKTYQERI